MSAFVIADIDITNPQDYEEYKKLAKPIAEQYGGTYRARGGELEVHDNDLWSPTRIVIIEFPDMASGKAFMNSPEYAPVKKIRQQNSKGTVLLVDGG